MKPDTIVALASGAGRAGVAVIRLSGPAAGATLQALTARDLPKPRIATREAFCDPRTRRSRSMTAWRSGFPARTASPAKTSPNSTSTAAQR